MHHGIGSPDVSTVSSAPTSRYMTNGSMFKKIPSGLAWWHVGGIGLTKSASTTPDCQGQPSQLRLLRWQAERLPYSVPMFAQGTDS
jgi:hypothetical protein